MKLFANNYINSYIIISIIYLLLLVFNQENVAIFFKPILIPFLVLMTINSNAFETKKWLVLALTLSWIGDVSLIFEYISDVYFIIGLGSFLLAHLLYIYIFLKQKRIEIKKKALFKQAIFIIVTFLYLGNILSIIYPKLGELKIPVIIYSITITLMLIIAIRGYYTLQRPNSLLILIGAVFFILSDSFLALAKFHSPLVNTSLIIMFTYIVAQFCISKGVINLNTNN